MDSATTTTTSMTSASSSVMLHSNANATAIGNGNGNPGASDQKFQGFPGFVNLISKHSSGKQKFEAHKYYLLHSSQIKGQFRFKIIVFETEAEVREHGLSELKAYIHLEATNPTCESIKDLHNFMYRANGVSLIEFTKSMVQYTSECSTNPICENPTRWVILFYGQQIGNVNEDLLDGIFQKFTTGVHEVYHPTINPSFTDGLAAAIPTNGAGAGAGGEEQYTQRQQQEQEIMTSTFALTPATTPTLTSTSATTSGSGSIAGATGSAVNSNLNAIGHVRGCQCHACLTAIYHESMGVKYAATRNAVSLAAGNGNGSDYGHGPYTNYAPSTGHKGFYRGGLFPRGSSYRNVPRARPPHYGQHQHVLFVAQSQQQYQQARSPMQFGTYTYQQQQQQQQQRQEGQQEFESLQNYDLEENQNSALDSEAPRDDGPSPTPTPTPLVDTSAKPLTTTTSAVAAVTPSDANDTSSSGTLNATLLEIQRAQDEINDEKSKLNVVLASLQQPQSYVSEDSGAQVPETPIHEHRVNTLLKDVKDSTTDTNTTKSATTTTTTSASSTFASPSLIVASSPPDSSPAASPTYSTSSPSASAFSSPFSNSFSPESESLKSGDIDIDKKKQKRHNALSPILSTNVSSPIVTRQKRGAAAKTSGQKSPTTIPSFTNEVVASSTPSTTHTPLPVSASASRESTSPSEKSVGIIGKSASGSKSKTKSKSGNEQLVSSSSPTTVTKNPSAFANVNGSDSKNVIGGETSTTTSTTSTTTTASENKALLQASKQHKHTPVTGQFSAADMVKKIPAIAPSSVPITKIIGNKIVPREGLSESGKGTGTTVSPRGAAESKLCKGGCGKNVPSLDQDFCGHRCQGPLFRGYEIKACWYKECTNPRCQLPHDRSKMKCMYCLCIGHVKTECANPTIICDNCETSGHYQTACYNYETRHLCEDPDAFVKISTPGRKGHWWTMNP